MKKLIAIVFAIMATVAACSPKGPDQPHPPTDTDRCGAACKRLVELGCKEGGDVPTPKGNVSCTDFCIETQKNGHGLDPTCVETATSCPDFRKRCDQ